MGTTIITWNMANWITVVLMVTVGLAVLGAGSALIKRSRGTLDA